MTNNVSFPASPGITSYEKDLSSFVSTSLTPFAGYAGVFEWGAVKTPVILPSPDAEGLRNVFGRPRGQNAISHAIAKSYLEYSNSMKVVRFELDNMVNSYDAIGGGNSVTVLNDDDFEIKSTGITGRFIAKYPGIVGDSLRVFIITGQAWDAGVTTTIQNVLDGNGDPIQALDGNGDPIWEVDDNGDQVLDGNGDPIPVYQTEEVTSNTDFEFWEQYKELFQERPSTSDFVNGKGGSNDEVHVLIVDKDGLFTGQRNTVLEKYEFLSQAKDAKTNDGTNNYYLNIINRSSAYVYAIDHDPLLVDAGAESTTDFTATPNTIMVDLSGGLDGDSLSLSNALTTYEVFSTEEGKVRYLMGGAPLGASDLLTFNIALYSQAESDQDKWAITSPPISYSLSSNDKLSALSEFADLLPSTSYGYCDASAVRTYDTYNDEYIWIPACGHKAGLRALLTKTKGEWHTSAGYENGVMRNIDRLAYNPSRTERDILFKKGLNPIIHEAGKGILFFGDTTLLKRPSSFNAENTRELFIFMREVINEYAKNFLFKNNNELTRATFRNNVEAFLRQLASAGGLDDDPTKGTPYYVKCDEFNNNGFVRDNNGFVGEIAVRTPKSIRYIKLAYTGVGHSISFEEIF